MYICESKNVRKSVSFIIKFLLNWEANGREEGCSRRNQE